MSQADGLHAAPFGDDDDRLVARTRDGDPRAFEAIFDKYFERLCAFAERYVRSAEAAEDIVMDVLHRCWVHRHHWEIRGTVRSYLYRAVANASMNEVRDRTARSRLLRTSMFIGTVPPGMANAPSLRGAGDPAQDRDLASAIRMAIEALPPKCRAVFVLKWEHGLSYQEIADTLAISIKTVEMQMSRAARALRARLAAYR